MIPPFISRAMRGKRKPVNALSHLSAAETAELIELYRQDDDKTAFLLHVRGEMLAIGMTYEQTNARMACFLEMVRQAAH